MQIKTNLRFHPIFQSEWLRYNTQVAADAGKVVEKEEYFSIVGVIASWYHYFGTQSSTEIIGHSTS